MLLDSSRGAADGQYSEIFCRENLIRWDLWNEGMLIFQLSDVQESLYVLVCSFYRKFQLKILVFGKWRDEVVQMQSRRIRKATLCKTLTYLERAESPLSPKVSLTTICDLCLLLRLPDRREYFPLLCGSWLQFFCFSSIGTNYVDHNSIYIVKEG